MKDDTQHIFIHIPKTGGTTINCAMHKSTWQTKPDFNYRHIDYQTKRSNAADIFNPLKDDLYKKYNVFMLLRHPVDRLLSEYSFIKPRPEFMGLIKPYPKNFEAYIKNGQTQNYMIGFLVGKQMYDTSFVTKDDLDLVKNTIQNIDIKVGIFEEYAASLAYFSSYSKLNWPKKIEIKRITLNRPSISEISEETKALALKHNALDFELYNYALAIFNERTKNLAKKNILFKGNKYDYVLKFTERFNLLEASLNDVGFLKANPLFFENLNNYLHHTLKVKDGKTYVELWNKALMNALKENCMETSLTKDVLKSALQEDPLERNIEIGKAIDRNFKNTNKHSTQFRNKLVLNTSEIKKPKKKFKFF
jgi:hypothetical protein